MVKWEHEILELNVPDVGSQLRCFLALRLEISVEGYLSLYLPVCEVEWGWQWCGNMPSS